MNNTRPTREPFTLIPNAVIDAGLKGNELAIVVALARHADNRTRTCHPSIGRIAAVAGVSPDTVKRGIRTLERMGIVSVKRTAHGGRNRPNIYTLHAAPGIGAASAGIGADSPDKQVLTAPRTRPTNYTHESEEAPRSAQRPRSDASGSDLPITRQQITYLRDLHIHHGHDPLDPWNEPWVAFSREQADAEIRRRQREMPRGSDYLGPNEDEPNYRCLSEQGRALADRFGVPERTDA